MDELIKLLNEYDGTPNERKLVGDKLYLDGLNVNSELFECLIVSKYYGFIKWLLDNDKIDRDKIIEKSDFMPIVSNKVGDFLQPTEEQELLMLLSISDTPIEDLISYLKIS